MSTRSARRLFALTLLTSAMPAASHSTAGSTFHVAPGGNDSNSCSVSLPCREIRRALELVGPGDTILVADGSYKGFDVEDHHGAPGSPITIRAQGAGAVIQKTTDRGDNRDTIFVTFSSYVVVDGLRSFGANRAALRVDQSPNVTVRNCVFGNNATWGIFTDFSDDLLIETNETYGSVSEHGIYVSNSGDRPIVRGNRSHDNRAAGIHVNADIFSGGDGIITGALIENNVIYNNGVGGGSGINMDGVQDSVIRNNLVYENRATGIALYQIDGAEGPRGNKVYHNTVSQASTGRWALLLWNSSGPNTVRNNVLYHPSASRGGITFLNNGDVTSTDSDYNILDRITPDDSGTVYTLAQWQGLGHETRSFSATPASLFVNTAAGDFHLAAGSPAIDRGQTLAAVPIDADGNSRPRGAASDVGAYESGGAPATPVLSVTPGSLAFGSVGRRSMAVLTVTVRNVGGGTLVGSASTTAPFKVVGTATYSLAANQTEMLTVGFTPSTLGAFSGTLSLTGGGDASVPLSGTGIPNRPVLSVTPTGLAFGSINVGSTSDLTVTVRNVGARTLTGTASVRTPFQVVGSASYALSSNQAQVLTVRYSPTRARTHRRTLSLTGGGGGSVSLSGTGVAPPN